ncbi:hypothetical protein V6N12_067811 [Hibiscus sabdariffa]
MSHQILDKIILLMPPPLDVAMGGVQLNDSVDNTNIFDRDDIESIEGDVVCSTVDGLISIEFSERVQDLAVKSLDHTIVVKLLGRRIGYNTLSNVPLVNQLHDPLIVPTCEPSNDPMVLSMQNQNGPSDGTIDQSAQQFLCLNTASFAPSRSDIDPPTDPMQV